MCAEVWSKNQEAQTCSFREAWVNTQFQKHFLPPGIGLLEAAMLGPRCASQTQCMRCNARKVEWRGLERRRRDDGGGSTVRGGLELNDAESVYPG